MNRQINNVFAEAFQYSLNIHFVKTPQSFKGRAYRIWYIIIFFAYQHIQCYKCFAPLDISSFFVANIYLAEQLVFTVDNITFYHYVYTKNNNGKGRKNDFIYTPATPYHFSSSNHSTAFRSFFRYSKFPIFLSSRMLIV